MQTISVATLDDTVPEAEEGFTVVLSNPSGAGLGDDTGEGTITDNDQPLELAIDDAPPVVEGGTAEFVVRLSAVSSRTTNSAVPPSTTAGASSIASSGGSSSSVMVPFPVSSSRLAPSGLLRTTVKPSSASGIVSSRVATEIVCTNCPAVKVSVPDLEV